jgi:hypothetical protein
MCVSRFIFSRISDCEGVTPLHLLVESNAPPGLVDMLISAGASANGVDYHEYIADRFCFKIVF